MFAFLVGRGFVDLTAPAGRSPSTMGTGGRGQSGSTWSIRLPKYVLLLAVKKTQVAASVVVLVSADEHKKGGKYLCFSVCRRE